MQVITLNRTASTHSRHYTSAPNISSTSAIQYAVLKSIHIMFFTFNRLCASFNGFHMIRCRSSFIACCFVEDTFVIAIQCWVRFEVFSQVLFLVFYCFYALHSLKSNQTDTKRTLDVMTPRKSIFQCDAMQCNAKAIEYDAMQ